MPHPPSEQPSVAPVPSDSLIEERRHEQSSTTTSESGGDTPRATPVAPSDSNNDSGATGGRLADDVSTAADADHKDSQRRQHKKKSNRRRGRNVMSPSTEGPQPQMAYAAYPHAYPIQSSIQVMQPQDHAGRGGRPPRNEQVHQSTHEQSLTDPQPGMQQGPNHSYPRRHRELFPVGTYKTEICRSHLTNGYCEYGANCQFAHGISELRPRHFDVKYKTQLCKNYHKDGNCRFGSRCKFIHDEHRIQVDTNEFWLVSPSENLVRVEIVENAQRRQQLQALVESPPPPPPNQGNLNRELEEKKRQVLHNARQAAARAAAARAAMQQALVAATQGVTSTAGIAMQPTAGQVSAFAKPQLAQPLPMQNAQPQVAAGPHAQSPGPFYLPPHVPPFINPYYSLPGVGLPGTAPTGYFYPAASAGQSVSHQRPISPVQAVDGGGGSSSAIPSFN